MYSLSNNEEIILNLFEDKYIKILEGIVDIYINDNINNKSYSINENSTLFLPKNIEIKIINNYNDKCVFKII